jgi:hypothetical protein
LPLVWPIAWKACRSIGCQKRVENPEVLRWSRDSADG